MESVIEQLERMSRYTYSAAKEKERKDGQATMHVKQWPEDATEEDRDRVCQWVLEQCEWKYGNFVGSVTVNHGFLTESGRYRTAKGSDIKFGLPREYKLFEKYCFTTFSSKKPLEYWCADGSVMQHTSGKTHRLKIEPYMSQTDQIENLTLQTVIHTLTRSPNSPFAGTQDLRLRATDKQIYDVTNKKVISTIIWNKSDGVLDVLLQPGFGTFVDREFEKDWEAVHSDHPLYKSYDKYPHRVAFADLINDQEDSRQDGNSGSQGSHGAQKGKSVGKKGRGKGTRS